MIDLPYSLMIEATEEPNYFSFYSTELEGFTGSGDSIEDCLHQAHLGMKEHVELLIEHGLPVISTQGPEAEPEKLDQSKGLLLVPSRNPSKLADAMERLAVGRAQRIELAANAKQFRNSFSWHEIAARTVEVYGRTVQSRAHSV